MFMTHVFMLCDILFMLYGCGHMLQGELEASQSEVAMLVEKERQVNKKMNALSAKLKAEEEEVRNIL